MPFVKDPLSLLVEASSIDMKRSSRSILNESTIRSNYDRIEEASSAVYYGPQIVPVVEIDGKYYTEMNFLYPYMKSAKISSIEEALNNVAIANNLEERSVGLLIESGDNVTKCINKAIESADPKKEKSVLDRVGKAINISDKLKSKGIDVKKKKSTKCPKCGKDECKCECGNCK